MTKTNSGYHKAMGFEHRLSLEFLGAAQTVTGSRTRVRFDDYQLLVDCGLFQGPKERRLLNWQKMDGLEDLKAMVLTHAHIDHSGLVPKLVKDGFRGPIHCSQATFDLCKIMLRDSAHLQEEDAKFLASKKLSSHRNPKPLYTAEDAELALKQFRPQPLNEWVDLSPKMSLRLIRSGHILGSTFVQLSCRRTNGVEIITFSGDIGNDFQTVLKGPNQILETDHLVLEGTYGDREINRSDVRSKIEKVVTSTLKQKGVLVIPAFAVGRTQELIHILSLLKNEKRIPDVPLYVDSPMANQTTDLVLNHSRELKPYDLNGELKVPLKGSDFKPVVKLEDSMTLCRQQGPFIVISASGMLSGGRVLHHLKTRLSDPRNCVLFVGYQADETKGKLLQSGLRKIRIHKQLIDVKARIETIDGLSAHAGSSEILSWVAGFDKPPKRIFLNHGHFEALRSLQYRLRTELKLQSEIPKPRQKIDL